LFGSAKTEVALSLAREGRTAPPLIALSIPWSTGKEGATLELRGEIFNLLN
jgi:hypothetical protein